MANGVRKEADKEADKEGDDKVDERANNGLDMMKPSG